MAELTPQLRDYLQTADLVVEGVVAEAGMSVRTEAGYLETPYTLRVTSVLAGAALVQDEVQVYTAGGTLDGLTESVSHSATVGAGLSGIFLLAERAEGGYYLHAGNAGKVTRLAHDDDDYEAIHWGALTKYRSWRQLREAVGAAVGVNLTVHPLTQRELLAQTDNREFCVKLDNPVPDVEEKTVRFDVLAKSSEAGLELGRAEILIDYPTGNLGEFIVDQEKIEAEKGDITDGPAYTIEVRDEQADQLGLVVESPCDPVEPHYVLDTVYEKLATLTVSVDEWGDLGTMNVEDFAVGGVAEYVNPWSVAGESGCTEFDELCGEGEFVYRQCTLDEITGVFSAGTGSTIAFAGSNLGDQSSARIFIPDANTGGLTRLRFDATDGRIVRSWSDQLATLGVLNVLAGNVGSPIPAGSGNWQFQANPLDLVCETKVEVGYAIAADNIQINSTSFREERYFYPLGALQREYGYIEDGSLEVYVDGPSVTASGLDPVNSDEVVREVICRWESVTPVEIDYRGITILPPKSSADPSSGPYPATKTIITIGAVSDFRRVAETRGQFDRTDRCGPRTLSFVADNNIVINELTDFYVGTGTPGARQFDLFSVLLHEFGHVLGHSHANDQDEFNGTSDSRIMYAFLDAEDVKREIDEFGIKGVTDFWTYTQAETSPGSSCEFVEPALLGLLDSQSDLATCGINSTFSTGTGSIECPKVLSSRNRLHVPRTNESAKEAHIFVTDLTGRQIKQVSLDIDNNIDLSDYTGEAVIVTLVLRDGQMCSNMIRL